jgi:hypothetical protein
MDIQSVPIQQSNNLDVMDLEMDLEEEQDRTKFDIYNLGQTIQVASEGALTKKTVATYARYFPYTSQY